MLRLESEDKKDVLEDDKKAHRPKILPPEGHTVEKEKVSIKDLKDTLENLKRDVIDNDLNVRKSNVFREVNELMPKVAAKIQSFTSQPEVLRYVDSLKKSIVNNIELVPEVKLKFNIYDKYKDAFDYINSKNREFLDNINAGIASPREDEVGKFNYGLLFSISLDRSKGFRDLQIMEDPNSRTTLAMYFRISTLTIYPGPIVEITSSHSKYDSVTSKTEKFKTESRNNFVDDKEVLDVDSINAYDLGEIEKLREKLKELDSLKPEELEEILLKKMIIYTDEVNSYLKR